MEIAMQDIFWAILSVAVGAIAVAAWQFASTLRKESTNNEQMGLVSIFVHAAEQMMGDQDGQARLDWVMAQLKAKFPRLDTDTIRAMIEANVKAMRQ